MKREHIWSHHEQDALINWKLAEGGYASRDSVRLGEAITLHISNSRSTYDVFIFREGARRTLVTTITNLKGQLQPVPEHGYRDGFNWRASTQLTIPESWLPGVYIATIPTAQGLREILFIVRPKAPASPLLITIPTNTYQAYNNVGGKCMYDYISTDRQRAETVSFDRPLPIDWLGNFYHWEQFFVSWLEAEGFAADYCVNSDFEAEPDLLAGYKAHMRVGHDEYNSPAELDQLEAFVNRGGNLLLFAGNTIWWNVNILAAGRQMHCRKRAKNPGNRLEDLWIDAPQRRQRLLGLYYTSFVHAKTPTPDIFLAPTTANYGFFKVTEPGHWVYQNTNLKAGDEFGREDSIVGVEADAADLTFEDGKPTLTGRDGANTDFKILAIADAKNADARDLNPDNPPVETDSFGIISINEPPPHASRGTIFVAATIEWSHGLYNTNAPTPTITRNILRRLAQ